MPNLLAVDWGSSTLRGALLDAAGAPLAHRSVERGMLTVEPGGFGAVFESTFGDWLAEHPGLTCLMAGMVGSRQGWIEAPYCTCPAGAAELAAALVRVPVAARGPAHDIRIVPGISCGRDGIPDVMRGEEVQVIGALELLGLDDAVLVLPGTHSKWVTVSSGRIREFSTVMSGEFYALLRHRSILARGLPDVDGELDPEAFDAGVARAIEGASLMQTAFGVRTLGLFGRMRAEALSSYLSGLVIGEELRCRPLDGIAEVIVVGAPTLALRFERALRQRGVGVRVLGDEAAWRGLRTVHACRIESKVQP